MGRRHSLVFIGMAVVHHEFSCVVVYVACGCAAVYDMPIFSVSGQKRVRSFSKEVEAILRD